VLAIQLMTILQAIDYLDCSERLSSVSLAIYEKVRAIFPKFIEDQPKYKDLERIKTLLETTNHINAFAQ